MQKNWAPLVVAILCLAAPLLYVGSYAALLDGRWIAATPQGVMVGPRYRIEAGWLEYFYYPLETIDRRLRPAEWDEWSDIARFKPLTPALSP